MPTPSLASGSRRVLRCSTLSILAMCVWAWPVRGDEPDSSASNTAAADATPALARASDQESPRADVPAPPQGSASPGPAATPVKPLAPKSKADIEDVLFKELPGPPPPVVSSATKVEQPIFQAPSEI